MTRFPVAASMLLVLAGLSSAAAPSEKELRAALGKALPLIQKGAAGHMAQRTCFACHHQALPLLAVTTARSRGVPIQEEEIGKHLDFIADFLAGNRDNYRQGRGQGGQADTAGYALWTLELGGRPADETTAAVAEYLLQRDQKLDHWKNTSNRPPSEASPFTTSYLALRALQSYGTPEQKERIDQRVQALRGWLARAPGKDTEGRAFRLWAMQRAGLDAKQIEPAARDLLQTQRDDGGWAQLDSLEADAYATGSALVALSQAAGLKPADLAYRRGLRYLLSTQRADGTWYVASRSKPFQKYFESGFPHGKDQWISLAASSWATTALALALPEGEPRAVRDASSTGQLPRRNAIAPVRSANQLR